MRAVFDCTKLPVCILVHYSMMFCSIKVHFKNPDDPLNYLKKLKVECWMDRIECHTVLISLCNEGGMTK